MDTSTSPIPSRKPPRQTLWQRLHTTLILRGILAPPGASEADLTDEERETRKQFFSSSGDSHTIEPAQPDTLTRPVLVASPSLKPLTRQNVLTHLAG